MDVSASRKSISINKKLAERVGFESALKRTFKDLQITDGAYKDVEVPGSSR